MDIERMLQNLMNYLDEQIEHTRQDENDALNPYKKYELDNLLEQACRVLQTNNGNEEKVEIALFYQNKSKQEFDRIENQGNIMRVFPKDEGGDQRNPINYTHNKLEGIFFSGNTIGGELPNISPFGNRRFIIPADRLFNSSKRLYFSDFYCVNTRYSKHYVTLVMTSRGSAADRICQRHLVELSTADNPFLTLKDGTIKIFNNTNLAWIEIFYTDEINIGRERIINPSTCYFTDTNIFGKGTSYSKGMKKDRSCDACNL